MKHPPYHLRVNKAVDRFLFIELIGCLYSEFGYSKANYYGFGGPFLEDFRLLHHYFPEINLTSLEKNQATYKRQQLHKSSKKIHLIDENLTAFLLSSYEAKLNDIFWLDYTGLKMDIFVEFQRLLTMVEPEAVIKITLNSHWLDTNEQNAAFINEQTNDFVKKFGTIIPREEITGRLLKPAEFPLLLQRMINVAAQNSLGGRNLSFELLHSCTYDDGTPMLSVTGMLCSDETSIQKAKSSVKSWRFKNHEWDIKPHSVNVPILSHEERIAINRYLPTKTRSVKNIANRLGYNIESSRPKTEDALLQYADFYRHYPSFIKVSP
ncbi:MAG: hypothetical protein PHP44_09270 [Kiritimatiellae bacterium]|nr:hypothetical protein [Kiritimatiellia bacterium]